MTKSVWLHLVDKPTTEDCQYEEQDQESSKYQPMASRAEVWYDHRYIHPCYLQWFETTVT